MLSGVSGGAPSGGGGAALWRSVKSRCSSTQSELLSFT